MSILRLDEFAVELAKLRDLLDDQTYTDREMRNQIVARVDEMLQDVRETADAEKATRPAEGSVASRRTPNAVAR